MWTCVGDPLVCRRKLLLTKVKEVCLHAADALRGHRLDTLSSRIISTMYHVAPVLVVWCRSQAHAVPPGAMRTPTCIFFCKLQLWT